MVEDCGIILKSFLPFKNKISILAQLSGRENVIVKAGQGNIKFSSGVVIKFFTKPGMEIKSIVHFEVLVVPIMPLGPDLYWFHHLLEICYYFIPLGSLQVEVFRLVRYALELSGKSCLFEPYFHIVRKIFLAKLLILLGFYPKESIVDIVNLFGDIVSIILDSSNAQKVRSLHALLGGVDGQLLKDMDRWILHCLHEHTHVKFFKTLPFFKDM